MIQGNKKRDLILGSLISLLGGSAPLAAEHYKVNHHWDVLGDFVFMRRSKVHNHTLVKDDDKHQSPNPCSDFSVLNTKDLVNDFDFEPGYRVGLTYTPNSRTSLEGNFLWLSEWEGEKKVHGDESLSFPFKDSDYAEDFIDASEAIGKYKNNFWDAELNFWHHFAPRRANYFALSGITGLRYFHWNETFELTMVKPPDRSSYFAHTSNKIYGLQIGLDFQMNPTRWLSWEMFAKVGAMLDQTEAKTLLRDQDNEIELRDFEKKKWQWGEFADIAAQFAIYATRWLNFHAGYEVLFFSGLALAPEQLSKKTGTHSGKKDYTHGAAIIHGLYSGLTFSF